MISKISVTIFLLKKIKPYLSTKAATLIYKDMILPIVEYGDIYLYSATKASRKKIQTLQNKALRIALKKDNTYGTDDLHKKAKLQKLKIRRRIHLLLHMYQYSQLSNFNGWKKRTGIRARSSHTKTMLLKKQNIGRFKKSVEYQGPKYWNALPKNIQLSDNYYQFKQRVTSHLNKNLGVIEQEQI